MAGPIDMLQTMHERGFAIEIRTLRDGTIGVGFAKPDELRRELPCDYDAICLCPSALPETIALAINRFQSSADSERPR